MDYRTDRSRVSGLGSAKDGTGHFLTQRITSIALIPLTLLFIFPFASALGGSFESVQAVYSSPFNAIIAILFLIVALYHYQQGMQVVIEDYIHAKLTRNAALLANIAFAWVLGLTGVFAVAKIAFTA